jgi:hypothetical protein
VLLAILNSCFKMPFLSLLIAFFIRVVLVILAFILLLAMYLWSLAQYCNPLSEWCISGSVYMFYFLKAISVLVLSHLRLNYQICCSHYLFGIGIRDDCRVGWICPCSHIGYVAYPYLLWSGYFNATDHVLVLPEPMVEISLTWVSQLRLALWAFVALSI